MIAGIFHQGSGLGNQLHRYVATRVLALDKGFEHGMLYIANDPAKETGFKGKDFMNLEFKELTDFDGGLWLEKKVVENGVDIRGYDPEINFVEDNTVVDGEFQDPKYFEHHMNEVSKWLAVEPLNVPDDVCVIGFRGGEFSVFPDLFLPLGYWQEGIQRMLKINENMKFEVHTDDPVLAQKTFPDFKVIQNAEINWRSMRYAKYAIIANSSFYIFPRLLKHHNQTEGASFGELKAKVWKYPVTIAPRYWARHNTKVWALPQNYYKQFTYV